MASSEGEAATDPSANGAGDARASAPEEIVSTGAQGWQARLLRMLGRGPFGEELLVAYRKDPALRAQNALEVILYQGVWALWAHRVAHRWWQRGARLPARALSQLARWCTGIEIHPGAVIGRRCFIDHGAGVVIGETAVLGDDVMLYHGVTLGGHGWWTDAKGSRRHPSIGDGVTLGVGCTILGPVHVGAASRIGPLALVVEDIPPRSVVVAERGRCVVIGGVRQARRRESGLLAAEWLGEANRNAPGDDHARHDVPGEPGVGEDRQQEAGDDRA